MHEYRLIESVLDVALSSFKVLLQHHMTLYFLHQQTEMLLKIYVACIRDSQSCTRCLFKLYIQFIHHLIQLVIVLSVFISLHYLLFFLVQMKHISGVLASLWIFRFY